MYTKEVTLGHNEIACKLNVETGELKQVNQRPNNIPSGKEIHSPKDEFAKVYSKVDLFLLKILTPVEYRVVSIMRSRSKMNTNSLDPLSDDSSIKELAEILDSNRNTITKVITRLREFGVFATFEVTNQYNQRVKCWILNPYISFKGKIISTEIIGLFDDTLIAKVAKN
jgi:DNA-binding MarR family transcriptional regulator